MAIRLASLKESRASFEIGRWVDTEIARANGLRARHDRPVALVVRCSEESDWNGAFSLWESEAISNLNTLLEHFHVHRVTIPDGSNLHETVKKVWQIAARTFDFLFIQGHGDENSIQLREDYYYTSSDLHKELASYMSPKCVTVLQACSTAPLALRLSKESQTIAFAPSEPASLSLLVNCKGDIVPVFISGDHGIYITKKYSKGVEQPTPSMSDLVEAIKTQANKNDCGAAVFLRRYYQEQRLNEEFVWRKMAIDLGDAQLFIANCWLDKTQDLERVEYLAQLGCPAANSLLGKELYGKSRYRLALHYLLKAAEAHDAQSCLFLMIMYKFGLGVDIDAIKSDFYLKKQRFDEEDVHTQALFAEEIYKDYDKAFFLYQLAVRCGRISSVPGLAKFYRLGRGTKRDVVKAAQLCAGVLDLKECVHPLDITLALGELRAVLNSCDGVEKEQLSPYFVYLEQ